MRLASKVRLLVVTMSIAWVWLAVPAAAAAATFDWQPATLQLEVGQKATLTISLNTQGDDTTGADAVISFSPAVVNVSAVTFSTPQLYPQNFFNTGSGTVALHGTHTDVAGFFSGSGSWAVVEVIGVAAGSSQVTFECQAGSSSDSNVLERLTAHDLIDCSSLVSASVTVTDQSGPASDPPPSPSPDPGSDPSPDPSSASGPSTSPATNSTTSPSGGTGGTSGTGGPSTGPSQTGCQAPLSPSSLAVAPTSDPTTLLLSWARSPRADHYSLSFGRSANNYQWGAANIGNTNQFLITSLSPATRYFVGLSAVNDCGPSEFAVGAATTAGGTTAGSGAAAPAPTSSPSPSATESAAASGPANLPSTANLLAQQRSDQAAPQPSPLPIASDETDATAAEDGRVGDQAGSGPSLILITGLVVLLALSGGAGSYYLVKRLLPEFVHLPPNGHSADQNQTGDHHQTDAP